MGIVENLERQVQTLSPEELAQFRAWFLEFDWAAWNRQLERDIRAGKLDGLAEKALRDHASGQTRTLWVTTRPRTSGRAIARCRTTLRPDGFPTP